ncbi:MAG: nitrogen fixation protein NifM, partial [Gammaproteobacteria bacterium]|nr:nitrogen fixation protein NifM [Gammaproteobacteria bacterium]
MSNLLSEKIIPDLRYIVLRSSLATYEAPPYELSSDKLEKIIRQAKNEHDIQSKILESDEALGVHISEETFDHAYKEVIARYENVDEF